MNEVKSFLGTGWSFPPEFNKVDNSVQMVGDIADIEDSIRIILSTTPGERIMQPEFGCDLKRLVFETIDSTLLASLDHLIYHALLNFEPRITFLNTEVLNLDSPDGRLLIQINFKVIITNTRHNIVFPFYLLEGTNVSSV
ncbi:MAG: GPW/gp25 family protein [Daejeonella sp.]|uniref:GPW/gp25 family protein n=1 Tax=Daejeonella sp. JGW-45 TaxID=3034148 RepID=UPI0023EC80F6|nr:GPW/gp25 family protein [Daejeonella sp. JGW-45]